MANHKHFLGILLFVLILTSFACKQQAEAPMEKAPALQVADGFQPARFTTDERTAQIASIGPKLHEVFETYAREKNIPGIAYGIVVDGQLVIDSALGYSNLEKQIPARTTSQFRIASMTKSFTAMGIMKLVEDGALSLHDPAYLYVPEMRDMTLSDLRCYTYNHRESADYDGWFSGRQSLGGSPIGRDRPNAEGPAKGKSQFFQPSLLRL